MATKKTSSRTTKKDLEAKIADLEAKLTKLSAQLEKPAASTQTPPPKPAEAKPAETKPAEPKPASQDKTLPKGTAPPPKQETAPEASAGKGGPSLEEAWYNHPMGDWNAQKAKVTGYVSAPNRYYARRVALVGKAQTQDWNLQKTKVPGYTAPSNQYFATRARMAYHPPDKTFTSGLGFEVGEGTGQAQQTQTAPPPPPPQPEPQPQQTTSASAGSGSSSSLEEYEKEYLARLDRQAKEQEELMRAAEELAAKRAAESQPQSTPSSNRGSMPKGWTG